MAMIITNNYNKFSGTLYHLTFEKYGKQITELLKKYPITNNIWHVYGEEFITSLLEIRKEKTLLDPWFRPFPEPENHQTVDKPSKHSRVSTTVEGKVYICNIYVLDLHRSVIYCDVCDKLSTNCIECGGTKYKTVYYPYGF